MRVPGVSAFAGANPEGVVSRTHEGRPMQDNRGVPTSVLIVDDHPSFRLSARRMLAEEEGFEVVGEAADGAGALVAVRDLDPDVVILDVQLPDLDGFEVAERLRGAGARGAIVLTSTRESSDFGAEIAASPVQGFVTKGELSGATIAALIP
jgi:DNA-binding NarL/FixJ family response regulator